MTRHLRKYIQGPDGHRYPGRWPQQMPHTGEGPYIAALARRVRGACEVTLPLGRIDVATDDAVFEVEPVASWRKGARQVMAYAQQTGMKAALALFGPADYVPIYLYLRDRVQCIDLWVWRGRWVHTTSRAKAQGETFGPPPLPPDVEPPAPVIPRGMERWYAQVPDHVVDEVDRAKCAALAQRAHMSRMAMKSAQKRSKPKPARKSEAA